MLAELRKGPLAGMDEDEFKMIEEDVKKFGFKGLSGYAKSTVMRAMRLMGAEINKAVESKVIAFEKIHLRPYQPKVPCEVPLTFLNLFSYSLFLLRFPL